MDSKRLYAFAKESNEIEGITKERRHLTHAAALERFLALPSITIDDLKFFVGSVEPTAKLRLTDGQRVFIGGREGLPGSLVFQNLTQLLNQISIATEGANRLHRWYEEIHPFTDGNGRSGRALWLWLMVNRFGYDGRYKFLQMYYYLTFQEDA